MLAVSGEPARYGFHDFRPASLMDAKRPPLPIVLTGNDLLEGHSVYYTEAGWTTDIAAALVGADEAGADALDAAGRTAIAGAQVADPYLTTVALDAAGRAVPVHYRERIRVSGPTVAYGRAAAREADHV